MDKVSLMFAMLFTSFFICFGIFGFAVGVPPIVTTAGTVADWVEQHPYLAGLIASEILGVLPVKANGLLHGSAIGGKKLLSLLKDRFIINSKNLHNEN